MALGVVITIAVCTVITMIFMTLFLSAYKLAAGCDSYKSIMCYIDWKCYYGTRDTYGHTVGAISTDNGYAVASGDGANVYTGSSDASDPNKRQGALAMECYLRGLYGDTSNANCLGFYAVRDKQACNKPNPDSNVNAFCKSVGENGVQGGTYTGSNASDTTGKLNPFGCICSLGDSSNRSYVNGGSGSDNGGGAPTCEDGDTGGGTCLELGASLCKASPSFLLSKAGLSTGDFCKPQPTTS